MKLSNGDNYRNRKYSVALPGMGIPFLAEIEEHWHKPCGRHAHDETQILAFLSGEMRIYLDDRTIDCKPGQACVIPPGVSHWVGAAAKNPQVTHLDVRLTASSGGLQGLMHDGPSVAIRSTEPRAMNEIGVAIASAVRAGGPTQPAKVMAALWQMAADVAASNEPAAAEDPSVDRRLLAAERYMQDHLNREMSVDDLATISDLSRSQLSRLYLKAFKKSPAARLKQLRIEQAEYLLTTSTLSVKEVAHVCGFVCANHFSRVYHELTGKTPTQDRRSA